jgi:transposase
MDRYSFQAFLDFANNELHRRKKRQVVICDNASWHKVASLHWGKLEVVYLPPYSPDLNPIEKLWLRLKCDYFQDFIAKTHDKLLHQLEYALCHLMAKPKSIASICSVQNPSL